VEGVDRRYLIRTFGCQMNEHDSERIAGLLESNGYISTDRVGEAEVVVLNTCAVRENADNRLYGNLGRLRAMKQQNRRMRIVVSGCLAQKDRGQIQRRAPWVDVVVGTYALPYILDLLDRAEREGPQMDVREYTEVFPSALPAHRELRHHAWVSVSVGCDNKCTFCIVPLVRGAQRSRPLGEIVAELQGLVREGVVEVTLLGQNVNTYGRDLVPRGQRRRPLFADLLRAVNQVEGVRRVRFTSPHPHDFTPDVIEAMAECESVCEHIHFPLQSGSDAVLRRMRRSYTQARYLEWLSRIRDRVPGIAVTTDVIVGFPGETEDDFRQTLAVVDEARFDAAYTFQYSPRPGTEAAGWEDEFVAKEAVQERFDRLVALQEAVSLERNRALEGSVVEALVEGHGRKGGVQGRTRTNKVLNFEGPYGPGDFVEVRVTRGGPHHLLGEPVAASVSA
jgi:tRNA-2-methylthio-N6-dimethylallyladenosine synthase